MQSAGHDLSRGVMILGMLMGSQANTNRPPKKKKKKKKRMCTAIRTEKILNINSQAAKLKSGQVDL